MKFTVNIDMVFGNIDYCDAIYEAKKLGFDSIEILFIKDKDIDRLEEAVKDTGINVELILMDFIDLTDETQREKFIDAAKETIEIAKRLGCNRLLTVSGQNILNLTHSKQLENIELALRELLPLLKENDFECLLEPVNDKVDHHGTFLTYSDDAFEIARKINDPRIKVLYDIYHMQVMEGDVVRRITNNIDLVGHLHIAGNPGRNEFFIGELDYYNIIELIDDAKYEGYFGLEYAPVHSPEDGLLRMLDFAKRHEQNI